jgi:hypothetical protein
MTCAALLIFFLFSLESSADRVKAPAASFSASRAKARLRSASDEAE